MPHLRRTHTPITGGAGQDHLHRVPDRHRPTAPNEAPRGYPLRQGRISVHPRPQGLIQHQPKGAENMRTNQDLQKKIRQQRQQIRELETIIAHYLKTMQAHGLLKPTEENQA